MVAGNCSFIPVVIACQKQLIAPQPPHLFYNIKEWWLVGIMLNLHIQWDFEFYSILNNSLWFYNSSDGLLLHDNRSHYMYVYLENYNFCTH